MDLRERQQRHLREEYERLRDSGCTRFDFMGGRRSGKTYFILQRLLGLMVQGYIISVATMTSEQGRKGAYQDAKDIINASPALAEYCTILTSPREIRCTSGGRMFFSSYEDPETAKGVACDYLYMNEGNKFTVQQFKDLVMSCRRSTFVDRNPNTECWTEKEGFSLIHSTWLDNKENLTDAQIAEFERLKANAEKENATQADIALYRMYYLGEYAEITGSIFPPTKIRRGAVPEGVSGYFVYGDPSALCGADYFALVLVAFKDGIMYVVDVFSRNTGSRADVAEKLAEWCNNYDVEQIFIEGNGWISRTFYEEQRSSFPIRTYTNTENKHGRILGNNEAICTKVVFNEAAPDMEAFLRQIYEYEGKNSNNVHDDNIDAVNSAYEIGHWKYKRV